MGGRSSETPPTPDNPSPENWIETQDSDEDTGVHSPYPVGSGRAFVWRSCLSRTISVSGRSPCRHSGSGVGSLVSRPLVATDDPRRTTPRPTSHGTCRSPPTAGSRTSFPRSTGEERGFLLRPDSVSRPVWWTRTHSPTSMAP